MSGFAFGIRMYDFGAEEEWFVGQDRRLWQWLIASNMFPHEDELEMLWVPIPEGYIFYNEMLVPLDSEVVRTATKAKLRDRTLLSGVSPEDDKGELLILSPFRLVSPVKTEDFEVLGVREDRIFAVTL